MNQDCDICQFPSKPTHQLMVTDHWNVGLGNNQAYLGRAYVTLRTHTGSLSELDATQWQEYEEIVRKLEGAYRKAFGADPFNWLCMMNNAYQKEPSTPHVHWHLLPRYKEAQTIAGITFDDPKYAHHYDSDAERLVSDEVVEEIAQKIKAYL